jgi:hypothetical protein
VCLLSRPLLVAHAAAEVKLFALKKNEIEITLDLQEISEMEIAAYLSVYASDYIFCR